MGCVHQVAWFSQFPGSTFSRGGVAVPSLSGEGQTEAGAAQRACAQYLAGT